MCDEIQLSCTVKLGLPGLPANKKATFMAFPYAVGLCEAILVRLRL